MQITVNTVKKMLKDELMNMYTQSRTELRKTTLADVPFEIMRIGFNQVIDKLDAAQTFEDLEDVVLFAGYRMSLQDWLDSY